MSQFRCPKCNYISKSDSRFCPNCGVPFSLPTPAVKQPFLPKWAIITIIIGSVFGGLILIAVALDSKKSEIARQEKLASATPVITPAAPTPTPTPSFDELKAKSDRLMKFSKSEYVTDDLKQFDEVMIPLRDMPKEDKNYKEAQKLHKKLIDKVAPIAAEIILLGPKPTNSAYDGRVDAVVDYLKDNLNDYDDSEWLEWSPVTKINLGKEPYWAVRLKLRAKNAFGAKLLKNVVFFIRDGRVVQTTGL